MKLAIPVAALLAAVASRGGCGNGHPAYDPCAGKTCGASCDTCPPGGACAAPFVPTACDLAGRCVPQVPGLCGADAACAGKTCGAECTIVAACRSASPPCMVPDLAGTCSAAGQCLPLGLPVPACPLPADCTGLACGAPCVIVPPCTLETPPCTVAALPGVCDGAGACLPRDVAPPP